MPSADVPFGLKLSNSKVTDGGLKALAAHKNLTALDRIRRPHPGSAQDQTE